MSITKAFSRIGVGVLALSVILGGGATAAASASEELAPLPDPVATAMSAEYKEALEDFSLELDLSSGESKEATRELSDGTLLTLGAEPMVSEGFSTMAALSGTWRIWGTNAFAYMEYYVTLAPASGGSIYTTVTNKFGMKINSFACVTYTPGYIETMRKTETATQNMWVRGTSSFSYCGVFALTGGVEVTVKNGSMWIGIW